MNEEKIKLIMLIIEMAIKYGWPFIINLIENLQKDNITLEDIKALAIADDGEFIPTGPDMPEP